MWVTWGCPRLPLLGLTLGPGAAPVPTPPIPSVCHSSTCSLPFPSPCVSFGPCHLAISACLSTGVSPPSGLPPAPHTWAAEIFGLLIPTQQPD